MVRPTSDRVREATFNALHSIGVLDGAVVLDLFCGSGALGIEALSRGAARAVFVDRHLPSIETTRANLASCGFGERARVVRGDALDHLRARPEPYDLALLDPPYEFDEWDDLLGRLDAAVVVIESDRPIELGSHWDVRRERRYGDTVVTIASRADGRSAPDPQESEL